MNDGYADALVHTLEVWRKKRDPETGGPQLDRFNQPIEKPQGGVEAWEKLGETPCRQATPKSQVGEQDSERSRDVVEITYKLLLHPFDATDDNGDPYWPNDLRLYEEDRVTVKDKDGTYILGVVEDGKLKDGADVKIVKRVQRGAEGGTHHITAVAMIRRSGEVAA